MSDKKVKFQGVEWEKHGFILLHREWCKGCGICVAFCPRDVLKMGEDGKVEVDKEEDCTGCALCELRCPDFAILVER
jgi:2-oxoglutarate ferredoxin oxidoreductase subunit delta